jgi:undecaprenyl-diphosphatase
MQLLSRICEGPGLALVAFAVALGIERRLGTALRTLAAAVAVLLVAGLAVQLLKRGWPMPRPLAVLGPDHVRVLMEPLRRGSFPSGHAAAAGSVAALLTLRYGRAAAGVWVLALLGALSRVYVGAHWTIDVVLGLALGAVVASASATLALALGHVVELLRPVWSVGDGEVV